MKHRTIFTLSLLCLGFLLVACGGGGNDPDPDPDTPASINGTLFFPGYLGDVDVSARNVEIIPGDVFVQFAPGINTQSVNTLKVADTSFKFARTAANDRLGIYRAEGLSAEETWQLIARLEASPEVVDAFPNQIFRLQQDDPECIDDPNLPGCEDGVLDDEEYCALFPEDVDFCGPQNPGGENPGGEQDPECIDNPNLPGCEDGVLDDEEYCAAFPEDVDFCGPQNPGGENPGGENPGGENPGGENPGGENPGGETPIPDGEKRPNDSRYVLQWHYDAFNLPRAWQVEDGTSNEVVVAVLDTGINQHPDIVDNLLPGYNFIEENNDPTDDGINTDFHGLHVAGTVAARTNNTSGVAGVSWGAKIVPVRVLGADGGSTEQILDGIEWAAKTQRAQAQLPPNPNPQARVINMSLGGPGECSPAIEDLFADIARSGTLIVAAAGNENVDVSTSWPGNCQNVLTVGATGPTNQRAPYSNYGTGIDVMAPGGDSNQVLERGGQQITGGVLSTIADRNGNFNYTFYDGTSMASPHVAGLAALMLAKDPDLTVSQLRTRLRLASRPLDAAACVRPSGNECGAGLIDAAAALTVTEGGQQPNFAALPTFNSNRVPTLVIAFFCLDSACDEVDFGDRSPLIDVPTTGNAVPYEFENLEPGTYEVIGWQDLDEDEFVDDNEPFGFTDPFELAAGEAKTGVDVDLTPLIIEDVDIDDDLEPQSLPSGRRARLTNRLR